MNDKRKRAMSILVRAREILAERLAERVIDDADQLVDDAHGNSYMDEIGTLYESVGGKLNNVNSMIAGLPTAGTSESTESDAALAVEFGETQQTQDPAPATFALFARQISENDLAAAGQSLSQLLGVDRELADRCAAAFHERLQQDPTTIEKAIRLRNEMAQGNNNASLLILFECFGLQGLQAVDVLDKLRATLA